jgi:cobalt-zinc-cadmium efflux system membrane fusion protein
VKLLQLIATVALAVALAAAVGVAAWWLVTQKPAAAKSEKPQAPATVPKVVKEDELNVVTITPEAEQRLGIAVAPVAVKSVRRVRVYGGEVTIPAGKTILVAAPLNGTLAAPKGGVPAAGARVSAGQPIFDLTPLLTPDAKANLSASLADADGQVSNAKAQVEAAQVALDRATRVLKQGAGSQRLADEAQAVFDLATQSASAAAARRAILSKVVGSAESGKVTAITIDAPEGGVLRTVSALPGQTVPSGAALFEVVDLSTLWVRLPLPVGDLPGVDRDAPAQVGGLAGAAGASLPAAKPAAAPPSANPLAGTVDLFYALPNPDGKLTPGQRVGVTVPLAGSAEARTLPWSAIVFDAHGGTWAYEQLAPRKYARRRVAMAYTAGPDAVLADGPPAGTTMVVAGTQELFGAETGFVK